MHSTLARPSDRYGYRSITAAAWLEWKIAKSTQGASDTLLGTAHPPRTWVDEELGYGAGQGPSLQVTMLRLDTPISALLGARTGRRRESAEARQARLRGECVAALYAAARASADDEDADGCAEGGL